MRGGVLADRKLLSKIDQAWNQASEVQAPPFLVRQKLPLSIHPDDEVGASLAGRIAARNSVPGDVVCVSTGTSAFSLKAFEDFRREAFFRPHGVASSLGEATQKLGTSAVCGRLATPLSGLFR